MDIIFSIFPAAIAYTIPLLMGALGGLYSERSGVTNLCIEGLMLMGCFVCAAVVSQFGSVLGMNMAFVLGILCGMAAATLLSLLHAVAAINLSADQTISGTAINMLSSALTVYLAQTLTGSGNITLAHSVVPWEVPLLAKIPFLGGLLFHRVFWTTIVCLIVWAFSWFLLYKTSFGLRLRACGEHPSAVASAGVNVHTMRYIGVLVSGALSGLGGAVYLITMGGEFNSSSGMNGLGFLAIAGLIFGQWKPLGILGSTFFFGLCYTIANMSRVIPAFSVLPQGMLSAFPYVATLIALVLSSKKSAAPLASGVPY